MHELNHSRIPLADEAATLAAGQRLAHQLTPGLVIYLQGELGAGKTTFVRGVLRGLGYDGRVKSPTYTLVESYTAGKLNLRHFDLYRFNDPDEWESAGFRDEFDGVNVCLVEWPERAAGLLPPPDLTLHFRLLQDGRELLWQAHSSAGNTCLPA